MKLIAAFFFLTLTFPAGAQTPPAVRSCQEELASPDLGAENDPVLREAFIAEYAELILADKTQNEAWIKDALSALSTGDIHVLMENSWLKKLNDKIFKNKDLVTALTNFHKTLFLEEIAKLGHLLKLAPYQDFKSTRLTFRGPGGGEMLAALEAAFAAANRRFQESPRLRGVVRESDLHDTWFRMGVGQSESEAALAARDARENGGPGNVSYFWDTKVAQRLESKRRRVQTLHAQILGRLAGTELMKKDEDGIFLDTEVFTFTRKTDARQFFSILRERYPGDKIDSETADWIYQYASLADEFSASILVAERELLTIRNAPHGVISLDFIGLGAENLQGTVKALVRAKNLNEAVRLTRKFERAVTEKFRLLQNKVKATVLAYFGGEVEIRTSGDDMIITPARPITLRDQIFLGKELSLLAARPFFRMSVINGDGALAPNSMELITHGESIEKILRKLLLTSLGRERVGEISLQIFIPDTEKFRKVFLILNGTRQFDAREAKIVRRGFFVAVKLLESELRAQGMEVEYDPTEAFALFGKKVPKH